MLYSGLTISSSPQLIIGELYFTQLGEPYIEVQNNNQTVVRYEAFPDSIHLVYSFDKEINF